MKKIMQRGFTVIELLVVVAIIGILVAILLANFTDARELARDDARQANLKEMQLAIELYRSQNGRYPEAGCGRGGAWTGQVPNYGDCTDYVSGLVPDYIAELPVDTTHNNNFAGYIYKTNGSGTMYKLMAFRSVEQKTLSSYDDEFARCPVSQGSSYCSASGPQNNTYAVYSVGAEHW